MADDVDSGVRQISEREVRVLLARQAAAKDAEMKAKSARRVLGALMGAVLTTVCGTLATVGWAQGKVDAGVAPLKEQIVLNRIEAKESLNEHKREEAERFAKLEKNVYDGQYRQDVKMDALLLRFNVPNPAPTPDRDAGR